MVLVTVAVTVGQAPLPATEPVVALMVVSGWVELETEVRVEKVLALEWWCRFARERGRALRGGIR